MQHIKCATCDISAPVRVQFLETFMSSSAATNEVKSASNQHLIQHELTGHNMKYSVQVCSGPVWSNKQDAWLSLTPVMGTVSFLTVYIY